jgi:hypothetical protein
MCDRDVRHWQGFTTPRGSAIRERWTGVRNGVTHWVMQGLPRAASLEVKQGRSVRWD